MYKCTTWYGWNAMENTCCKYIYYFKYLSISVPSKRIIYNRIALLFPDLHPRISLCPFLALPAACCQINLHTNHHLGVGVTITESYTRPLQKQTDTNFNIGIIIYCKRSGHIFSNFLSRTPCVDGQIAIYMPTCHFLWVKPVHSFQDNKVTSGCKIQSWDTLGIN